MYMKHLLFIGAGNIAQAIAHLVKKKKGVRTEFWDIDKTKIKETKSLGALVPRADFICVCVPSWHIRSAILSFRKYLKKNTVVFTVAKGIEDKTGLWIHEVLEELLPPGTMLGLLSGPMLAAEIRQGLRASAVFASEEKKAHLRVSRIFLNTKLQIEYSSDVSGVAMCGVFKNIYSIALGICEGLRLGSNMKGYIAMQSVKEMMNLVQKLGGRAETALGPAGFGDLLATGFSPASKNHSFGRAIAENGSANFKSEGSSSLQPFLEKIRCRTEKYPVLHLLRLVLLEGKSARKAFEEMIG